MFKRKPITIVTFDQFERDRIRWWMHNNGIACTVIGMGNEWRFDARMSERQAALFDKWFSPKRDMRIPKTDTHTGIFAPVLVAIVMIAIQIALG